MGNGRVESRQPKGAQDACIPFGLCLRNVQKELYSTNGSLESRGFMVMGFGLWDFPLKSCASKLLRR